VLRDYGELAAADQCGVLRHSCPAGTIVTAEPAGQYHHDGDKMPMEEMP